MSTARARWSDAEKKAVLDCYNLAADADDFFKLLELALGASYFRRTLKAYLTYLNDHLLPKSAPRKPIYELLLAANQEEIHARKEAMVPTPSTKIEWINTVDLGPAEPKKPSFTSLFRDPEDKTPATVESPEFSACAAALGNIASRVTEYGMVTDELGFRRLHAETTMMSAKVMRDMDSLSADERREIGRRLNGVVVCVEAAANLTRKRVCTPLPTLSEVLAAEKTEEGTSKQEVIADYLSPQEVALAIANGVLQTVDGVQTKAVSPEDQLTRFYADYPQEPKTLPGNEAGRVKLTIGEWEVEGHPLNQRSVGNLKSLLMGEHSPDVVVKSGPDHLSPMPDVPITPTSPCVLGFTTPNGNGDSFCIPSKIAGVTTEELTKSLGLFETPANPGDEITWTLEAVHDGILSVSQGVTILNPGDHKTEWALSLLAATKITVAQCDRLLTAKCL